MKKLFAIIAAGLLALTVVVPALADYPRDPAQQNPDIYEIAGYPSPTLQTLNPVTMALKAGDRDVNYRYIVMAGCYDGNMRTTLGEALASSTEQTGIRFHEDNVNYDFTIRANCGVSFTNICGSGGAVACLGRGWPYVDDVDISTIMATFYDLSQVSIWEHEIMGHGMGTWNEQYQFDGSFSSTPNFVDFMNTGPNSRFDWPVNDLNRWARTMWLPLSYAPPCTGNPCWTGSVWKFDSGWTVNPVTDQWFDPNGRLYWWAADQYGWRYSPVAGIALPSGSPYFDPAFGHLISP